MTAKYYKNACVGLLNYPVVTYVQMLKEHRFLDTILLAVMDVLWALCAKMLCVCTERVPSVGQLNYNRTRFAQTDCRVNTLVGTLINYAREILLVNMVILAPWALIILVQLI